jgi:Lrp/AsnC family leucine-responsive transcriptional regulator
VTQKLQLDPISLALLEALEQDARLTYAELGRLVGLSAPAAAERVRRLEDLGIVTGYRAVVDRGRIGYPLTAFVRLRTPSELYPKVRKALEAREEVLECHHITGEDSMLIKLACRSIQHLDEVLNVINNFGSTASSVVLSTFIERPGAPPPVL